MGGQQEQSSDEGGGLSDLADLARSLAEVPIDHERLFGEAAERLQAIVRLAGSVGTRTIAEFVGDQPTLDLLSDHGVDYAQAYHVGPPRPVAAL